jgi:hypothetical protein
VRGIVASAERAASLYASDPSDGGDR